LQVLNRTHKTLRTIAVLFVSILGLFAFFADQTMADSAGTVHFVRFSNPSFDQYTDNPSPSTETWLTTHMWRLGVYSHYFDSKTSWYPNGWLYDDSYAIYGDSALAGEHPEWILRDSAGNRLYIPYGCSNGTCPQYAADISNRAYRRYWIENAQTMMAKGYRGLFVDDVNMDLKVGNGQEEHVAPIDPSTGQPMTEEAWRSYMATFMQEIRAALPSSEIVHNVIWFAANHAGTANASIRSEISSANYIFLERGVNDSGLTGGTGSWSVNALLSYVDEVHALGRGIVLDGTASDPQGLQYNLASYFLVSTGNDAVSGGGQTPENWWAGWSVNLGEPLGARYSWNNLLRRDFTGGMSLVNPPGSSTRTISLPSPMQAVDGSMVTTVTLPAASGVILRGAPQTTPSEATVETAPVKTPTSSSGSGTSSGGSTSDGASGGGGSSTSTSGITSTPQTTQPAKQPRKHSQHKSHSRARAARVGRLRRTRAARTHRVRHRAAPMRAGGLQ
jgi:hypothetical protein